MLSWQLLLGELGGSSGEESNKGIQVHVGLRRFVKLLLEKECYDTFSRKILHLYFSGSGPAKLSELRKTVFEKCIHFGDTAQVLLFFVKCNERVCVNNVSLSIRPSISGCSKCLGLSHQSVFQVGGQDEDPLGRGAKARSLAQLRLLLQLHHSRRGEWLSLSARSITVY